ncbi:MAG: exo-beta-N-acetylmuramidase NamZ domain-containing protein [Lentimicrobium sp.]
MLISLVVVSCSQSKRLQKTKPSPVPESSEIASEASPGHVIRPAAERTRQYFNKIKGKRLGIVANQTSVIGNMHLVDSLLSAGMEVVKVFSPEHGFRGQAEAGELVGNNSDSRTGLPLISLYGDHRKPTPADLEGIDLMLFDLQDVGTRFYTYISTLTLVMEACAESKIPVLVLDRPNPNGFFIDGPMLEPGFKSFVGMHTIPIVHGMTMAEYARMVNGELWLKDSLLCDLDWVEISGYSHRKHYHLPVRPSPNLPDMESVYLYPSLCLFEGTMVSVGRGTDLPFSIIGYPGFSDGNFQFTPEPREGASLNPAYKGIECSGYNLRDEVTDILTNPGIRLNWLILMYNSYPVKTEFFTSFFNKLAGSGNLRQQIEAGMSEDEIKATWQDDLIKFKKTRHKYLLYHDF